MAELSINEAVRGYSHVFKFDYVDLQRTGFLSTIGAANQAVVGAISSGGIIDTAVLLQVTDPAGATDLTIDFGVTGGDPDELLDNGDVDALTKVIWNTGDAFVGTDSGAQTTSNVTNGYANNTSAAVDLLMEFNGDSASLTAGEWILAWNEKRVPLL